MAKIGAATLHQIMPQKNYLLQNFHPALIRGQSMEGTEDNPRPCRARVRWCDATDEGRLDARDMINLWGSKQEREHFAQLAMHHPNVNVHSRRNVRGGAAVVLPLFKDDAQAAHLLRLLCVAIGPMVSACQRLAGFQELIRSPPATGRCRPTLCSSCNVMQTTIMHPLPAHQQTNHGPLRDRKKVRPEGKKVLF
jgi:hypothetical protein